LFDMPLLNIKLGAPASTDTTQQVVTLLTDLTHTILKKRREVTAVQVEYIPPAQWFIGASALQQPSFSLDVKVTAGTNTKDEMARYLQAVFVGMTGILGELEAASYAVIHEVRADSWGYSGLTQEFRYVANQAK
jgi:4-oxalocrotonate tautomerase